MDYSSSEIHTIAGQVYAAYLYDKGEGHPTWRIIGHGVREQAKHAAFTSEDYFWRGCIDRAKEIQEVS